MVSLNAGASIVKANSERCRHSADVSAVIGVCNSRPARVVSELVRRLATRSRLLTARQSGVVSNLYRKLAPRRRSEGIFGIPFSGTWVGEWRPKVWGTDGHGGDSLKRAAFYLGTILWPDGLPAANKRWAWTSAEKAGRWQGSHKTSCQKNNLQGRDKEQEVRFHKNRHRHSQIDEMVYKWENRRCHL